jgi:hypothetical protein
LWEVLVPTHSTNDPLSDVPSSPDVTSTPPHPRRRGILRRLAPIFGLAALAWFLLRVLPKPSRATYPCQRAAFPVATGFIIWLLSFIGFGVAWRKARQLVANAKYAPALACFILAAFLAVEWWNATPENPAIAVFNTNLLLPNHPVGTARGIFPGRVTWAFDQDATSWDGVTSGFTKGYWGTLVSPNTAATDIRGTSFTDQARVDTMMANSIQWLTGTTNTNDAWNALFHYFNKTHYNYNAAGAQTTVRGDVGYAAGETIFIKCNWVNMPTGTTLADGANGYSRRYVDPATEILVALITQLQAAGVSLNNITMGDPDRDWPVHIYRELAQHFGYNTFKIYGPNNFTDTYDTTGTPPSNPQYEFAYKTVKSDGITPTTAWYTSSASVASYPYIVDHIPDCWENATYVINLAQFKTHARNGISLAGKSYIGSMGRSPMAGGSSFDFHSGLLNNFDNYSGAGGTLGNFQGRDTYGLYRSLVDLACHRKLGGNVVLNVLDNLYSGYDWSGVSEPKRWYSLKKNVGGTPTAWWPSSIFMSVDTVAIDSVGLDFWQAEKIAAAAAGAPLPRVSGQSYGMNCDPARTGVEDYLVEMAMADAPFSGTVYKPDGVNRLASQGVFEHWNNSTAKKYSRNLGTSVPGSGIELVTATPAVAGRWIFYNNSAWDNPASGGSDDTALATDKTPLLPGGTATFINYTSYSKGINGVMIDVPNVPVDPAATDFICTVGNNNTPAGWTTAPTPTVSIRRTQGYNGSDRIVLTWADKAITGKWLRVQMVANAGKNLPADVFYVGNAPGDTGNFTINTIVDSLDENAVLNDPHDLVSTDSRSAATITNTHDFNRDRKVDATDAYVARHNATTSGTALQLITVP